MTKIGDNPNEKYKDWFYKIVGENIRKYREKSGDTQEALADALQISRVAMNTIEQGKQRLPLHILNDVVFLLKVSIDDIVPLRHDYK